MKTYVYVKSQADKKWTLWAMFQISEDAHQYEDKVRRDNPSWYVYSTQFKLSAKKAVSLRDYAPACPHPSCY